MHTLMKIFGIALFVCLLTSCSSDKKKFTWNDDVARITDKDLVGWLKKAPFDGFWDPSGENPDAWVITNVEQVFPFMGRYHNEDGPLIDSRALYEKEYAVYKDPKFGELFVYAHLAYEPGELFVDKYMSTSGNPAFSGINSIHENYSASLGETQVIARTDDYKTAIYLVSANFGQHYLFAIYQKANLAFQVGIPLTSENQGAVLAKIRETNEALGLHVKEWENLDPEDLAVNKEPTSFWKDPYQGLYLGKYFLPDLKIKIKGSPLREQNSGIATEKGSEYYFSYTTEKGEVALGISTEETPLSVLDYFEEHGPSPIEYEYDYLDQPRKVFAQENIENGRLTGKAETYFRDNRLLNFSYAYPDGDTEARALIENIFEHLYVRPF